MERPCVSRGFRSPLRDEAMDNPFASWDTLEFVKTDGPGAYFRSTKSLSHGTGTERAGTEREGREAQVRAIS